MKNNLKNRVMRAVFALRCQLHEEEAQVWQVELDPPVCDHCREQARVCVDEHQQSVRIKIHSIESQKQRWDDGCGCGLTLVRRPAVVLPLVPTPAKHNICTYR